MTKKILVLSVYPAPYRLELFQTFKCEIDTDIFFEYSGGDKRDERWFLSGDYSLLDEIEGRNKYIKACKNLKQYDLIVLYDYTTKESRNLIAKCKREKIPYAINCDGVMLPHKKSFLKDLVKRWLLSGATAYLASGEHAREYFLRYGAKRERVFTHTFSTLHPADILQEPISKEEKLILREKLGLPTDKKIAVAVGRFIPLKRYDYLLKEWSAIDEKCSLLLIGGGEEIDKYRAIIKENGLKNVNLEPFHPPVELYEYYKASDVFIHPTSYDVWGLVVNEAMAKGLPVVVSDTCVAGLELVENGKNGYLFPMGQEKVGIEKLSQIIACDDTLKAMAVESIKTIRDYTIENMAKTHIEVFKKVLK